MDCVVFNITFVAKLRFNFEIRKFITMKNKDLDVRGYYQGLPKKAKGKFLRYLSWKYDYPASTLSAKLRENAISPLRKDEMLNIQQTIREGIWKQ